MSRLGPYGLGVVAGVLIHGSPYWFPLVNGIDSPYFYPLTGVGFVATNRGHRVVGGGTKKVQAQGTTVFVGFVGWILVFM